MAPLESEQSNRDNKSSQTQIPPEMKHIHPEQLHQNNLKNVCLLILGGLGFLLMLFVQFYDFIKFIVDAESGEILPAIIKVGLALIFLGVIYGIFETIASKISDADKTTDPLSKRVPRLLLLLITVAFCILFMYLIFSLFE